jgi:hypothetical protein
LWDFVCLFKSETELQNTVFFTIRERERERKREREEEKERGRERERNRYLSWPGIFLNEIIPKE